MEVKSASCIMQYSLRLEPEPKNGTIGFRVAPTIPFAPQADPSAPAAALVASEDLTLPRSQEIQPSAAGPPLPKKPTACPALQLHQRPSRLRV
jgi:hypothetical protein